MDEESRKTYVRGLALFSSILGDLIGYTGAGVLIGWLLHRFLALPAGWMIATGGLGLAASFAQIYRKASRWNA